MEDPIIIHFSPEIYDKQETISASHLSGKYNFYAARPLLTVCDAGSYLLQYKAGDDYWIGLCVFDLLKDCYFDVVVKRPCVSFILLLNGNITGKLSDGRTVYAPDRTFNFHYLPTTEQRLTIREGKYVLLAIIPPTYYLNIVCKGLAELNELLNYLRSSENESKSLTNLKIPYRAWRIIKRLENIKRKNEAAEIELRNDMLALLSIYSEQFKQDSTTPVFYSSSREKAIAARNYIKENLGDNNLGGLNELAIRFYISTKSLNREFKVLTGKTIPRFIAEKRLAWAKELLLKKEMPVYEIALIVGFTDTANFIRKYKKHYGYSPGKERKHF